MRNMDIEQKKMLMPLNFLTCLKKKNVNNDIHIKHQQMYLTNI